ncbi:nucleoside-diphosphate sugar epimerase [Hahella sp. CCB-MM4]|uniref:NAD-dependent epimerase/dehydratase family protein n=1 Tax=Hahella sp. (strain CCB-MM4) TaxID=1926491 RepID=UPI000B9A307D|nr:NAD-dependent epimerase/dehydratase family protein [Hahella sp. CCB-MM4]OZG74242.1 nucleoside-diphosphate sugar epimerase [Hahella sp. CCB-MM4]
MHQPHLLLLGYGHLNQKVAHALHDRFRITAVSRSPHKFAGGQHLALDLRSDSLSALPDTPDLILFCLTPGQIDEKHYRQTYLEALKRVTDHYRNNPPKHFLFVSSTSVYGQDADEVVDEDSVTAPDSFSGKILVEAETWLKQQPFPTTSIRFSGIYGGHRARLLQQIINGEKSDQGPSGYTNRIHEEDAANVLVHLLLLANDKEGELADCYLASDNEPVRMHDVVAWVRTHTPCQPIQEHTATPRRTGSKQCSNQRLRESGFKFTYPDFRAGYGEMIARITKV